MLESGDKHSDGRRKGPDTSNDWMITFADLLALLLTFFVLLFAMSTVKVSQWQSLVESLSREFNPNRVQIDIQSDRIDRSIGEDPADGLTMAYLERLMSDTIAAETLLSQALVGRSNDEVIIAFPLGALFDERSLRLAPNGEARLALIANKLALIPNQVRIAVHAAPAAQHRIGGQDIAREFTLAQSRIVAETLSEHGYRRPIVSIGYGTSRFDKLDIDLPQYERQTLADRVDIKIIRDGRHDIHTIF